MLNKKMCGMRGEICVYILRLIDKVGLTYMRVTCQRDRSLMCSALEISFCVREGEKFYKRKEEKIKCWTLLLGVECYLIKCEMFIKQAHAFIIIKYKLKTVIYLFSIFYFLYKLWFENSFYFFLLILNFQTNFLL